MSNLHHIFYLYQIKELFTKIYDEIIKKKDIKKAFFKY